VIGKFEELMIQRMIDLWTRGVLIAAGVLAMSASASAQWLNQPTSGLPRNADGSPNLSAPAPRNADGKPDLSGVWQSNRDADGPAGGIEGIVAPRYMFDLTVDMKDRASLLRPEAAAVYKARAANEFRDNPTIRCLPLGVPRLNSYTHPFKIVQTAGLIVILYESQTTFRQIFMDGRKLPVDAQPAWYGYSIGRWEGDTLVVESSGFNDRTWLDGSGHPHSESMRLTERFTRRDVGRLDVEITIDDPVTYVRPLTYMQTQSLLADSELIEYICNENHEANLPHVKGKP
jgi:hypothetical protein